MKKTQYAFVGGSSSEKINSLFYDSARKLGIILSENEFDLVFGACNYGLMGEVYRTMKQKNAKVTGIAPILYKDDFKQLECDEEYCVATTSERINLMIDKSDIICFLPGGTGTLEEMLVVIEMKRRKEIDKPIIIYDETNFYLPLIKQLKSMDQDQFSNNCTDLFEYIVTQEGLNEYLSKLIIEKNAKKQLIR